MPSPLKIELGVGGLDKICWRVGEVAFPAEGWSDRAVPILRIWLVEVVELLRRESRTAELPFMGGPHWVKLRHGTSTHEFHYRLSWITGFRGADDGTVSVEVLVRNLIDVADRAARAYTEEESADDIRALIESRNALASLRGIRLKK